MKAENRDVSISLIRGIAMLMVITCHLCEQLSQGMSGREADFFLWFGNYCANGVQIFLFISGYLYAGKDRYFGLRGERITFLGKSFAKILFPYYVYSFLVILPVYAAAAGRPDGKQRGGAAAHFGYDQGGAPPLVHPVYSGVLCPDAGFV